MAMVQTTMQELLEFKDEFLRHDLPPIVLSKLALITGKVFRSVSDLHIPVNELLRLVHVYSIPWEEKSTALKKLHEDYENKQRQLNIAIKRLQLVDAHSKRIAREKRIMNWEKLFSRLTTVRGHGRRWKFLIDSIKDKAKLGLEHVQQYVKALDESDDDDEDQARDWEEEEKMRQALLEKTQQSLTADVTQPEERFEESVAINEDEDYNESEEVNNEIEKQNLMISLPAESDTAITEETETISRASSSKKVHFEDEPPEKAETSEACVWTAEPEYDQSLHIRVYKPEGLEQRQLQCLLSFGTQVFKTSEFDALSDIEDEQQESSDGKEQDVAKSKTKKRLRKDSKGKRYEEIILPLPDEPLSGVWSKTQSTLPEEQHLKIAVHAGPQAEMIAMATIQMDDIKELNLHTLTEDLEENEEQHEAITEDVAKHIESVPFPLYSLHVSGADSEHKPCGSMPLVMYWGQRLQLRTHDRKIATESVRDLVLDLTGIDLDVTTKDDLQKEYKDEALSSITFTPDIQEDMVSRADYDKLIMQHNDELRSVQHEYEMHIHELMMSRQTTDQTPELLDEMKTRARSAVHTQQSKLVSIALSPIMMAGDTAMHPRPPSDTKPQKNFRVGRPLPSWGDSMPQDFFARLDKYNVVSEQHRRELSEKIWAEMNEELEKKLSGQRRLNAPPTSQKYDAMQDVSLPALFMPFKSGTVFNPRAHQYFHPSGSFNNRLTQPPSMFQLPPLPKSKHMAVLNLFDLSRNFHSDVPDWLMARYIMQQQPRPKSHDMLFQSSASTIGTSTKVLAPWSTKTASENGQFLSKNSNMYQPVDMDMLFSDQSGGVV